jgi:hypothetical protein
MQRCGARAYLLRRGASAWRLLRCCAAPTASSSLRGVASPPPRLLSCVRAPSRLPKSQARDLRCGILATLQAQRPHPEQRYAGRHALMDARAHTSPACAARGCAIAARHRVQQRPSLQHRTLFGSKQLHRPCLAAQRCLPMVAITGGRPLRLSRTRCGAGKRGMCDVTCPRSGGPKARRAGRRSLSRRRGHASSARVRGAAAAPRRRQKGAFCRGPSGDRHAARRGPVL